MKKSLRLLVVAAALGAPALPCAAQDDKPPLRNADVVKMLKARLPENTVLLAVQSGPSAFDTSADALIELNRAGVPAKIIDAMIQASARPAKPAPQAGAPAETAAGRWGSKQAGIESDRVYLLDGDKRVEMKFTRPGSRTMQLVVNHQYAVIGGAKARLRSPTAKPEFELILPSNVEVGSVVALGMLAKRDNGTREIAMASGFVSTTQGLPSTRNIRILYEKAADQSEAPHGYDIYRVRPAVSLKPAEYAFIVAKPDAGLRLGFSGPGLNYNFYEFGVD